MLHFACETVQRDHISTTPIGQTSGQSLGETMYVRYNYDLQTIDTEDVRPLYPALAGSPPEPVHVSSDPV